MKHVYPQRDRRVGARHCRCLPAAAQQFINILTGGTSGVYYPLGVALSQVYTKAIPEAKSTRCRRPRPPSRT